MKTEKLIFYSIIVGFLVGILELYIGHRYILDPMLYGKEAGFIYETYLAPTFYGLTKSIIVAITFFLVYFFTMKTRMKENFKPILVGILGTVFFGVYYYYKFPSVSYSSALIIGLVHFSFIAGISYLFTKFNRGKF